MKKHLSFVISGSILLTFIPLISFAEQNIELWDPEKGFSPFTKTELSRVIERRTEREIISRFWDMKKGVTSRSPLPSTSPRYNNLYTSGPRAVDKKALAIFWNLKKGVNGGFIRKSQRVIEQEARNRMIRTGRIPF